MLSDVNLKGMLILVCHDDQLIAEVNYEKGIEKIEIEIIPSQEDLSDRIFSLKDFLKVLEEARQLAIKCAKEDEEMREQGIEF
ncbi:MAG TPA: hypothetical protein PLO43_00680 [Chlamydiales bacterium]|nr:hypothetical protein [Chlamydiales bacterium]HPE84680.1 hypothetical protein [Chlamydiales bacterium]